MRVRVVHWKDSEAEPLLQACRDCGFEVEYTAKDLPLIARAIRTTMPDALVIDLTRLPSHGRELALAIRSRKYSRSIPIIFVDGAPEKIEAIRQLLPDAVYATRRQLCSKVKAACAKKLVNPVAPPTVMERYGTRTKAQKLGIKEASSVAVITAPRDYLSMLGEMPSGVEFHEFDDAPDRSHPVTLWFIHDPHEYRQGLRHMRSLAGKTKLWVVWPKAKSKATSKAASNGLNQNVVRAGGIEVGLVDYKICAVGERWSGMVFAPRRQ
jgi:CheY-like chemotaxis protein